MSDETVSKLEKIRLELQELDKLDKKLDECDDVIKQSLEVLLDRNGPMAFLTERDVTTGTPLTSHHSRLCNLNLVYLAVFFAGVCADRRFRSRLCVLDQPEKCNQKSAIKLKRLTPPGRGVSSIHSVSRR